VDSDEEYEAWIAKMRLAPGQKVRLRREASEDEWHEATVLFASDTNPSEVWLQLQGVEPGIGGGGVPLSIDYERESVPLQGRLSGHRSSIVVAIEPHDSA
jgi:hypothetical protein